MRVVDPRYIKRARTERDRRLKKSKQKRRVFFVLVLATALLLTSWLSVRTDKTASSTDVSKSATVTTKKTGELKDITPAQMKDLINGFSFPNTKKQTTPPVITGNEEADIRIRQLAEKRGYKLRPLAQGDLVKLGDKYLQPAAVEPWKQLQAAASEAGQTLSLVSGYRSINDQWKIFEAQMGVQNITANDIASGQVDDQVDQILQYFSAPGYSRHHTGFTVDIGCNGGQLEDFEGSSCDQWLSTNNYAAARSLGWLPSYPKGASRQGPEPEPWEFVWVGRDALTN